MNKSGRRKTQINDAQKNELIKKVLLFNQSIIQISKELKINYSSAKTIIFNHRKKHHIELKNRKTCNFSIDNLA